MKIVHSWLKEYLDETLPSVEKVEDLLNFHAFEIEGVEELEGESVIDVDVLPNRASDCLCHRGMARELATILNVELEKDPLREPVNLPKIDKIEINIEDSQACSRFTATLVSGIEVKDSPQWLQKRLKAIGQRPINNIVDATNYVMYAIGQPLHAYDADLFNQKDGKWKFDIRHAKSGETISLLTEGGMDGDRVVELKGEELLIVDGSTNTLMSLAGVKGGRFAVVHEDTTNIIIEAANFDPSLIRKTARGLGIVIDASKRFENEPSRELPPHAQRDVTALILEIAGGTIEGLVDEYPDQQKPVSVTISPDRVNELLGLSLQKDEIKNIILRTGAQVEEEGGILVATSPWERTDLNIEEDYIEEVGRIHGLSNVTSVRLEKIPLVEINSRQYYSDKIRETLFANGFSEVITSSFQKKGNLQLRNALASDKSYLRSSLVKNITKVLDANYNHVDLLALPDIRVFEIGTVFSHDKDKIAEKIALTLGVRTKGNGYTPKDDITLELGMKAVSEMVDADLDWKIEKGVAELDFSAALETLPAPSSYSPLPEQEPATFKTISQYPAIARDVALWVGESEEADSVISTLTNSAGDMCVRQTLFDTFTKEGRTSYAFRLVFQSESRTLTDLEINAIMQNIYQTATEKGWEVR